MENGEIFQGHIAYRMDEIKAIVGVAEMDDQDWSGRYNIHYRTGFRLIRVFDGPEPKTGLDVENRLVGALKFFTDTGTVSAEASSPFTNEDLLRELAVLELRALRCIKNGLAPGYGKPGDNAT